MLLLTRIEEEVRTQLDPEEEEFRIQTSIQDESGPSGAEIEEDDDRSIPSSGFMHTIIPNIPDQIIEDDDVQDDLAPLDEPIQEPGGDIKQTSQFRYRSSHLPELILSNLQLGIQTRSSSINNNFFAFNVFLSKVMCILSSIFNNLLLYTLQAVLYIE